MVEPPRRKSGRAGVNEPPIGAIKPVRQIEKRASASLDGCDRIIVGSSAIFFVIRKHCSLPDNIFNTPETIWSALTTIFVATAETISGAIEVFFTPQKTVSISSKMLSAATKIFSVTETIFVVREETFSKGTKIF